MGLFKDEQKPAEVDPLQESVHSMNDFSRRIGNVERSAYEAEKGISSRDEDMTRYFEYVRYEIEALRQEGETIKRELLEADAIMKQIIRNIRELAQNRDIKELNDMIRHMNLNGMLTRADFLAMISDAEKQQNLNSNQKDS